MKKKSAGDISTMDEKKQQCTTKQSYHVQTISVSVQGDANSIENDVLSTRADHGSDSDGSASPKEASTSSTPYTGSPAPFNAQVEGMAGWVYGLPKCDGSYELGVQSLVPTNSEEAYSISLGHDRGLGKKVSYHHCSCLLLTYTLETLRLLDGTEHGPISFHSTNTSAVCRRHHVDLVGGPNHANVKTEQLGVVDPGKILSVFRSPFDGRVQKPTKRITEDPEKQELVDGSSTSQASHHHGVGYTVLVIALGLGMILYRLWAC